MLLLLTFIHSVTILCIIFPIWNLESSSHLLLAWYTPGYTPTSFLGTWAQLDCGRCKSNNKCAPVTDLTHSFLCIVACKKMHAFLTNSILLILIYMSNKPVLQMDAFSIPHRQLSSTSFLSFGGRCRNNNNGIIRRWSPENIRCSNSMSSSSSSTATTSSSSSSTDVSLAVIQAIDDYLAQDSKIWSQPTPEQQTHLEQLFQQLEEKSSPMDDSMPTPTVTTKRIVREPNRSKQFFGEWYVWYTNCPPPSNGKLGPFQGWASQMVYDSGTHSYENRLCVPPQDWLTATLVGIWEEWDGQFLDDKLPSALREPEDSIVGGGGPVAPDWGANHWKVTFQTLQIRLWKNLVWKTIFPSNTARIWRTTYLDDQIRIVRAGKTGRIQDEVVFYTKRIPPPSVMK